MRPLGASRETVSVRKKPWPGCRKARNSAVVCQVCLWPEYGETWNFMVPRGLEPRTLRLLAIRSNQLSYETSWCFWRDSLFKKETMAWCRQARDRAVVCQVCLWPEYGETWNFMVPRGLEPRALRLLAVRSNQLSYETLQRVAAPALRTARCAAVVRNNSRGQPPPGVPRPSHHTPSLPLPQPPQSPMVASVLRGHT